MADQEVARLVVGGLAYQGWMAVRVQRGMAQCAGGFELKVSELWPGQDYSRKIEPGADCQVLLGDEPAITGYVDRVDLQVEAQAHEVEVSGRDKTADLVDCSAMRKPGQWRGQKIERIAADLAQPFGVAVRAEVDTGAALPSFALQEGETAFEALERAARLRGLLLVSDGLGTLVITRAGRRKVPTKLVLGANLLRGRATLDLRDRFSEYHAKGQAPGSDLRSGAQVAQLRALARDPAVPRFRPFLLTCDTPDLGAGLRRRAEWECSVRAARSLRVQALVQGWRHADGLWEPNTLVPVVAEPLRLDAELLIEAVEYRQDGSGTVCLLQLTGPDAYSEAAMATPGAAGVDAYWKTRKTKEAA